MGFSSSTIGLIMGVAAPPVDGAIVRSSRVCYISSFVCRPRTGIGGVGRAKVMFNNTHSAMKDVEACSWKLVDVMSAVGTFGARKAVTEDPVSTTAV